MDDSCAVCAETLQWVAYGSCGHKDVCSTCVARLRFICNDRRCCICKYESAVVFVTKALGEYTRTLNDFSVFPSEVKEGYVGSYWYHDDTQAYFDDLDHYKMIKAMCKLSCNVCDKEDPSDDGSKRKLRFRSMEQLKGHLFHRHRLLMCSLCLEGRKVFICEQKLYTKSQLNQHISTGDSEVDGTESERGGFTGHPLCEFCRSPFYGDNELYSHMSTEHFTCHICKRQHPGQYEYYKNYDDLEIHFRREHFLCEDEDCLAKKWLVFPSEAEMKKHNALEHGGRTSRSQRSAALQIPTSFRYRRTNEQDVRRGRGRIFKRDLSDDDLSRAIEASLQISNVHDSSSSSNVVAAIVSEYEEMRVIDEIVQPIESLASADSEPSSRYLQALSHKSRNSQLEESSFPPLPIGSGSSQQKPVVLHYSEGGLPKKSTTTMAENLRRKNKMKVNVLNSAQATWPAASSCGHVNIGGHSRPLSNGGAAPVSSLAAVSGGGPSRPTINQSSASSSFLASVQTQPACVHEPSSSTGYLTSSSNWGTGGTSSTCRVTHSASAPDLVATGSLADFPPVSAAVQVQNHPASGTPAPPLQDVENVYAANNQMVERIRAALEFDHDRYSAFREISGEFRQGLIDAESYLAYAEQFGLSHLVLDLARLCPDIQKEKELVAAYNAYLSGGKIGISRGKASLVTGTSGSKTDKLTDSFLSTVRMMQPSYRASEEDAEMLSKDGYRASAQKWKAKVETVDDEWRWQGVPSSQPPPQTSAKLSGENNDRSPAWGGGSNPKPGGRDGRARQKKKTSKFHRARLGVDSLSSILDRKNSDPGSDDGSDSNEDVADGKDPGQGLPVRGAWRNGGGLRLLGLNSTQKK